MKFLCALCVLWGVVFPASALDREAFTFTRYNLNVTIDRGQQRLAVRGKITLRNDSDAPQQNFVLQISSTLHWASIQIGGKPAEYVTQTYNSDIDHTSALSEAIVTLPRAVAPKQTVEVEVGYEGVIPQDVTRLTRIGVPADTAKHSDWDQISAAFTGVRGIGYVAWYPIATDAASMADATSVSEMVGRWKQREQGGDMRIQFSHSGEGGMSQLYCDGVGHSLEGEQTSGAYRTSSQCEFEPVAGRVPLFLIGSFQALDRPAANISFIQNHKTDADNYALAAEQVFPFVSKWFGDHRGHSEFKAEVVELPDANASPFQSGNMLLTPLTDDDTGMLLSAVQLLTHVSFPSPRAWISEGLARYAAVRYVEQEKGRDGALNYVQSHLGALVETERHDPEHGSDHAAEHSLVNATDEFYVQAKSMNVWWMLRDLVGEVAFTAALHNYKANDDKDAMYMQKLLEAQAHRDLTWFFDDWVYVTVENLGGAAADVPVTLQMVTGEATEKLMVPGKFKASVRITAGNAPMKAAVNGDGSVPESDMTNNTYRIESLNH